MVRKRKRPPRLSGGGLGDPKAKEAPAPKRRGPQWSHTDGGPLASAAGAPVIPKRRGPIATAAGASVIPRQRRPPRPRGGGLGGPKGNRPPRHIGGGLDDPKAKEAPSPQRRGPRWSQRARGPLASAAGASVIPKRKRPPRLSGGGLSGGGLGDPKEQGAPSPQQRRPRWF